MDWKNNWKSTNETPKEGGQGKVIQVQNINGNEFGALKVMHDSQAHNSSRRERFHQEIEALNNLNHKGVPKVKEFKSDLEKTNPYFITEWIDGQDLNEAVQKSKFTIEEALKFTRNLALIVDACHQAGIIHRDIKPQNIRIREGNPVLIDFGICWIIDENEKKKGNTPLGEELGNRFLRLPELTAGSLDKHQKICDVTFIVGILFFLITNKHPRQLKDSDNKMPHERLTVLEFSSLSADPLWDKIKRIFNIGFQQSSSLRFNSCIELIEYIDNVLQPSAEKDIDDELNEYQIELAELINTDELQQRRKSVEYFKKLNDRLYKDFMDALKQNGTSVSNNENSASSSHKKNMYIGNNMFEGIQTIVSHKIELKDNKILCSYSIKEKQNSFENHNYYYQGHITDHETLKEAVDTHKKLFIAKALENFTNQLKK